MSWYSIKSEVYISHHILKTSRPSYVVIFIPYVTAKNFAGYFFLCI